MKKKRYVNEIGREWDRIKESERKDKANALSKKYYADNKEKIRAKNYKRFKDRGSLWPSRDKVYCRKYQTKWRKNMSQATREKRKISWGRKTDRQRDEMARLVFGGVGFACHYARNKIKQEVMAVYGGHCVCCGESNIAFLNVDHVNNDGSSRRKGGEKTGAQFWRRLKQKGYPKDMQILCFNCNLAKHIFGKCPHSVGLLILSGDQARV